MSTTITGEGGVSQVQNNTIVQADLTTAILPLGVGQSWSNMTAVRAFNTDYTNDTGRPIEVRVTGLTTSASNSMALVSNGVKVAQNGIGINNNTYWVGGVIPSGAVYRVNTVNIAADAWSELR